MRKIRIIGLALVTLAAATGVSAPASAHDDHHHHPVCHWEHHHGHKARVCR